MSDQDGLVRRSAPSYGALDSKSDVGDGPIESQPLTHGAGVLQQIPKELRPYLVKPTPGTELPLGRSDLGMANRIACMLCLPYAVCCKMALVREGEVGLTWHGQEPELLGPGRHFLASCTHSLSGIRRLTDSVITHGPINIVRVRVGELGFGLDTETGSPMLLTAGKHVIRSPTFRFQSMLDLTNATNDLGVMKLVRVETGCVGYAYRRGELVILKPGLHVIVPPDRFGAILSTQQQTLALPEGVHESSDYVPLKIRADVFYRIVDPKKALTNIRDVEKQIRETAVSTLAGIIRSSTLVEIANSQRVAFNAKGSKGSGSTSTDAAEMDSKQGVQPASAPPFFQHVHDKFMAGLHDYMLEGWGIELHNIRIESLKIDDSRLASDISKQAVEVSQQEARYRMLQKQAEVIQVEADNKKTQRLKEMEATAQIIRAQAEAEAEAVVTKAKAQADAKRLLGQGEADFAASLARTPLGAELAKLRVNKEALQGLAKVVYVPHLPQILDKTQFIAPIMGGGRTLGDITEGKAGNS